MAVVAPFDPREAHERIIETCKASQAIDLRAWEEAPTNTLKSELVPRVSSLLDRALEEVSRLRQQYEPSLELDLEDFAFPRAVDEIIGHHDGHRLADLAFIAGAELRQRRQRLEAPVDDSWELVCECGSALRRTVKSLAAIEGVLCEQEALAPQLRFDSELATSLETRREYRRVWTVVTARGDVTPRDAHAALRSAGTMIAIIVGHECYSRLREHDRFQFRALQRRILEWLRHTPHDLAAGARLWEDFASFAQMLRQVSLRQELLRHDDDALARAAVALRAGKIGVAMSALANCSGLDDELDAALEGRASLAQAVARLGERRAPPPPPPQPAAFELEAFI